MPQENTLVGDRGVVENEFDGGKASCERVLFAEKEQVMTMLNQIATPESNTQGDLTFRAIFAQPSPDGGPFFFQLGKGIENRILHSEMMLNSEIAIEETFFLTQKVQMRSDFSFSKYIKSNMHLYFAFWRSGGKIFLAISFRINFSGSSSTVARVGW